MDNNDISFSINRTDFVKTIAFVFIYWPLSAENIKKERVAAV